VLSALTLFRMMLVSVTEVQNNTLCIHNAIVAFLVC